MRSDQQRITYGVRRKCTFACLLVGVLLNSCSRYSPAGAEKGEFLGYRIGERYPITQSTKLEERPLYYLVAAEHPVKPDEFGPVYLSLTKTTYTIVGIVSSKGFSSEKQQHDFAKKYTGIIRAQYSMNPLSSDGINQAFNFGPEDEYKQGFYLLVDLHPVFEYCTTEFRGGFPVHIGLIFRSNKGLQHQMWRENLERDRGEAGKKGLNRGL